MTEKSHVSMEQHQCPVCLVFHDTGNLLLDKRLKPSMERTTVTGHSLCLEHQKLKDEGYIALIELTREPYSGEDPLSVPRTGSFAHVRAAAWPQLFNVPAPEGGIAVVEAGVIDKLKGAVHG